MGAYSLVTDKTKKKNPGLVVTSNVHKIMCIKKNHNLRTGFSIYRLKLRVLLVLRENKKNE